MSSRVLVVYCHPNPKSYTHAVLEAVLAGLGDTGCEVRVLDLHAEGYDPVLVVDETHRRRELDRVAYTAPHREALVACDALVLVYPVWWGGFPAMLKGWFDRTFVSGVAYTFHGRPENAVFPTGLLRGKELRAFYTLDAPWLVGWFDFGWLGSRLALFGYCGMSPIRRHFFSRLKRRSAEERAAWLVRVEATARGLGTRLAAR